MISTDNYKESLEVVKFARIFLKIRTEWLLTSPTAMSLTVFTCFN